MINGEKKTQYWNHFTDESYRGYRPKRITDLRLKMIKETVLGDDFLWQEIFSLHPAFDKTPGELAEMSPSGYKQARASFWAMIREKIQFQIAQSIG